jgi:hypothetical protein
VLLVSIGPFDLSGESMKKAASNIRCGFAWLKLVAPEFET